MTRQDWQDLVWWMCFTGAFMTIVVICNLAARYLITLSILFYRSF